VEVHAEKRKNKRIKNRGIIFMKVKLEKIFKNETKIFFCIRKINRFENRLKSILIIPELIFKITY